MDEPDEPLYCTDCDYFVRYKLGVEYSSCARPCADQTRAGLVSRTTPTVYCSVERNRERGCGPKAVYFVPRKPRPAPKPWWKFWSRT